jgi:hypothetical protein
MLLDSIIGAVLIFHPAVPCFRKFQEFIAGPDQRAVSR